MKLWKLKITCMYNYDSFMHKAVHRKVNNLQTHRSVTVEDGLRKILISRMALWQWHISAELINRFSTLMRSETEYSKIHSPGLKYNT